MNHKIFIAFQQKHTGIVCYFEKKRPLPIQFYFHSVKPKFNKTNNAFPLFLSVSSLL